MTVYSVPKPSQKKQLKEALKSLNKPAFGIRKALMKTADALWSKIVRARHARCIWCGIRPTAHAHHIFSRKHYSTRHDIENGAALCRGCHLKAHTDPTEFHAWVEHFYLKIVPYSQLKMRANLPSKKVDLNMRILELKAMEKK